MTRYCWVPNMADAVHVHTDARQTVCKPLQSGWRLERLAARRMKRTAGGTHVVGISRCSGPQMVSWSR